MYSRRSMLKGGLVGTTLAGGWVAGFGDGLMAQILPMKRLPLEQFVTLPGKLEALRRGVRVMKGRKPSDPTSWFFQGAIHAVTEDAIASALEIDQDVAAVDRKFWNQCPHMGQNSANFLPWHRGYLYYFERILRVASGDPELSLPYWNYLDPQRKGFPPEFGDPQADPVSGLPRNPLFDHRREAAFAAGMYDLSARATDVATAFSETVFFGASESSGFAGGVADGNPRTKGRIERSPHDLLHFAIGGSIGFGDIDDGQSVDGMMSSVTTAAFDPIFWVHHANIDRMWTVWDCEPDRTWGTKPPNAWFDEKPWFFHDHDASVQNHSRLHLLNRANLPVSYDTDKALCSPLSASDPRGIGASVLFGTTFESVARPRQKFVFRPLGAIAQTQAAVAVGPDDAVTAQVDKVALPGLTENAQLFKSNLFKSFPSKPRQVLLELTGVSLDGVTSVGFDVFVNLPDGAEPVRSSPHFVGSLALFGARRADMHMGHALQGSGTEQFDATRAVADSGNLAAFTVKIVPFDLLVSKTGERIRRPAGVKIASMRLVVMEGAKVAA